MRFAKNDIVRLLILASLVTFAYWPFIINLNLNMGGSDARWYQYILHDALIQLQHGIFPAYIGQSEFSFFGGPVIRAPYYLLLGQLINTVTFNQLNVLCIQHLTVLFSAYSAAFLLYFLLVHSVNFFPVKMVIQLQQGDLLKLRWIAAALAFLYISCPGVMGVIYRYDMYYSFMTVPYVPLVIYGLIRSYQKRDLTADIVIAMGLSLTWMAHPPIAVWVTSIYLLFLGLRLVFLREGLREFLLVFSLFFLLNLWQFISIVAMGVMHDASHAGSNISDIITLLSSFIPGVFLPLQWVQSLSFIQLGYGLWAVALVAALFSVRSLNYFPTWALLVCALFLLLLLYPLPVISLGIWSLIPSMLVKITDCPMFRFYIILAAIICFVGMLATNIIYRSSNSKLKHVIFYLMLISTVWGSYQSLYFINALGGGDHSWLDSKNIYFTPGQTPQYLLLSDGNYDPLLKNQILNAQKLLLTNYDNEQFILKKCFSSKNSKSFNLITPGNQDVSHWSPLFAFKAEPNTQYLLCLNTETSGINSMSWRINSGFFASQANAGKQNIAVPFFVQDIKNENVTIALDSFQSATPIKIIKAGVISYQSKDLPIQVTSYIPYKATVITASNNNYLNIFKNFSLGYLAKVNGEKVPVIEADNHTIIIPLKDKGLNQIELQFVGFLIMKIAFYISAGVWIMLLSYLLLPRYRLNFFKENNLAGY